MLEYKEIILGDYYQSTKVIDVYKGEISKYSKNLMFASEVYPKNVVSIDWLPFASEQYELSNNPKDYVIVPVTAVISDIPNKNLQGFKIEDITSFSHDFGMIRYETFKGKPTHKDHKNDNYKEAKGVILDADLKFMPQYNLFKIIVLSAWDRTKDVKLVNDILSKVRKSYSMGAYSTNFECSVCGHDLSTGFCKHFYMGKGKITDEGNLIYELASNPVYFELSSVENPAYISAINEKYINF